MRRLNLILGILGSLAFYGCTLDEPLQLSTRCGDKAHPLSMVVYNNIVCTPDDLAGEHKNDSCTQFLDAFKNNSCPLLSPLCIHENDDDDYVCSTSHCQLTHHEVDGQCEPNTVIHCGGHGVDCEERMPGWVNGSCLSDYSGGKCFATQCENGYELNATEGKCEALLSCPDGEHIYNGECEPDSVDDCGRHDFSCAVRTSGWVEGTCQKGICVPSQCDVGYELENGACVAKMICEDNEHIYKGACEKNNVINCGFHGNDCRQSDGWVDGDCVESRCFASACEEGYELNAETGACRVRPCDEETEHKYGKICEKNSVEHCGQHDFNCSGRVPGWSDGSCVNGRCEASACTQGYRFDTGAKACVALINCEENTHVSGEDCAPDSLTACGSDNNDCTKRAGWAEGSCVAADCVATACVDGYEVKDGQCVSAIKTCAHCASNEVCVDGRCVVTGCMQDCNTYNHATSGICGLNGACIATACIENYHLYDGSCESNSMSHCGKHGVACDAAKHEVCNTENGTCDCESGYERYDGICQVEGYSPLCDENNYMTVMYEGEEIRAWCIKTVDDLKNVKSGYPTDNTDKAFVLIRDLDVGDTEWNPNILGGSKFFGNYHAISGKIRRSGDVSLFSEINSSFVMDLYLNLDVLSTIENGKTAGLSVTSNNSIIENVHFNGSVKGYGNTAGFVVNDQSSRFLNCSVKGAIESFDDRGGGNAGGLAVSLNSNGVVDNCFVEATIKGKNVGGIAVSAAHNGNIQLSHYSGNINAYGYQYTGGIVATTSYGTIVSNCGVNASIVSNGDRVGGIVGEMGYGDSISNYFYGKVSGVNMVGGVVGRGSGNLDKIIQCAAIGEVYGSGEDVGGLFGSGVGYVNYSVSLVDVHGARSGGLIGTAKSTFKISNTYTFGIIDGGGYAFNDVYSNGGIVTSDGFVGGWYNNHASYFNNYISVIDNNVYYGESYLLDVLTDDSVGYVWGNRECDITIGPAEGNHVIYSLPIPIAIPDIPNCKREWINEPY